MDGCKAGKRSGLIELITMVSLSQLNTLSHLEIDEELLRNGHTAVVKVEIKQKEERNAGQHTLK